jgi:hypothetical protein
MKHIYKKILLISFVIVIMASFVSAQNIALTIASPANNTNFNIPSDIKFKVNYVVTNDTLTNIILYQNGLSIGTLTKDSTYTWKTVPSGYYAIHAVATDKGKRTFISDTIHVNVGTVEVNNKIINGEFHGTTWPWKFDKYEGAVATFTLYPTAALTEDSSAGYIQIQTVGAQFWGVQLMQYVNLDSGHAYDVSFVAWATESKPIQTVFAKDYGDYGSHWWQDITLAAEPKAYGPYTFNCKVTDHKVYFKFVVGGNLTPMFLDAVKVKDKNIPTAVENQTPLVVNQYMLHQNYPNPFNPTTAISYQLKNSSNIHLAVYNLLGKEISVLASGSQEAGYYQVNWNATDFASGVYFYRLISDDGFVQTRKLLLMK